eukprot:3100992-Pyramimonas_sp.AAC.2
MGLGRATPRCARRSWMIFFAETRGVRVFVEQPANSMMYKHIAISSVLKLVEATRIITYLSAFGAPSLKPLECFTTLPDQRCAPLIADFRRSKKALERKPNKAPLTQVTKRKHPGSSSKKGWAKDGWVSKVHKGQSLKASQTYPVAFCRKLASAVAGKVGK